MDTPGFTSACAKSITSSATFLRLTLPCATASLPCKAHRARGGEVQSLNFSCLRDSTKSFPSPFPAAIFVVNIQQRPAPQAGATASLPCVHEDREAGMLPTGGLAPKT